MRFIHASLLFVVLGLAAGTSHAAREPIVNHDNVPVPAVNARPPTLAAIEQAIITAGLRQNPPWVVTQRQSGTIRLSRLKRARQSAVIDIAYTNDAFSILYVSSYRMGYRTGDGGGTIDAKYNAAVADLRAEIEQLLLQIPASQREPAP